MKRNLFVIIIVFSIMTGMYFNDAVSNAASGGVPLSTKYFDRSLKGALKMYDTNDDNYLSDRELRRIRVYECDNEGKKYIITELRGLEHLKYMKVLDLCRAEVTGLELNKLTQLKYVHIHNSSVSNQKLDFSKLKKLKELYIVNAGITEVKFGKNKKLKRIWLGDDVKKIDMSKNKKLKKYVNVDMSAPGWIGEW